MRHALDFDRERTIYNGRPFSIGFEQPLFGFNELRWDKKIEPLRYQESQQHFGKIVVALD